MPRTRLSLGWRCRSARKSLLPLCIILWHWKALGFELPMSHRSFAAIWTQLEGRPDIANIVREQIGEHILDSSDAPNLDRPLTSSLPLIALFKVIFDLQRTYYQCSTAQVESAHLLPTRLLRLAIIYLLRIKCKALRSASTLYAAQRSFLARVLISGLRALWLALGFHRCHLPDESVKELSIAFDQAWKGEELVELDRFLIRIQHIIISAELSRPTSDLSIPARGKVRLPNHSTGLVSILKSFKSSNRIDHCSIHWKVAPMSCWPLSEMPLHHLTSSQIGL